MSESAAKHLGVYLREQRELQNVSKQQLADRTGIPRPTIVRIEQGDFERPGPDKLKAIASALGLSLTDVWSLAGYHLDEELPGPLPFLRAKYRDLSSSELNALTNDVAHILRRHGIDPHGRPENHEDEADSNQTAAS